MAPRTIPLAEKLERYVAVGDPDKCWPYTGPVNKNGYGIMTLGKKIQLLAHRVAYEQAFGPIPDGLIVRHLVCDNPPCCNPDHLAVGTHFDNAQDRVRAGRSGGGRHQPLEECHRGHNDWYIQKSDGRRRCRLCRNDNARRRKREKAESNLVRRTAINSTNT